LGVPLLRTFDSMVPALFTLPLRDCACVASVFPLHFRSSLFPPYFFFFCLTAHSFPLNAAQPSPKHAVVSLHSPLLSRQSLFFILWDPGREVLSVLRNRHGSKWTHCSCTFVCLHTGYFLARLVPPLLPPFHGSRKLILLFFHAAVSATSPNDPHVPLFLLFMVFDRFSPAGAFFSGLKYWPVSS